jgi:hypothetical protein
MKTLPSIRIGLVLVVVMLAGCSSDSDCPICPSKCYSPTEWVEYDNFDDNTFDDALWNSAIAYGGQVLETSGQLQVWGHTGSWTGYGGASTRKARLAWRFDLADTYFEEGAGCQGWYIRAVDMVNDIGAEVLNRRTAGCASPPNWGDGVGSYEIRHEEDSLAVYRDGTLLRRVYDNGIEFFNMEFNANNVYGDGHHCHVFVDNVWGLEYKP